MSFDQTLVATGTDIVLGLRNTTGAFADMVCKPVDRDSTSGTEPVFATAQTLGRVAAARAIGTTMPNRNATLSDFDYVMQEFGEILPIAKAKVKDLEQYMDPYKELLELLVRDVDAGIDAALAALLVSATYNNSQAAATGVWSLTTSTPILDLQTACNKTPGADMLILGKTSAQELARHPDIKERSSNYAGNGAVGMTQLKGALGEALEIDPSRVFIFGSFYNSASPGLTSVTSYIAGDLAWVGHSGGLRMYEQMNPVGGDTVKNLGQVSTDEKHNIWEIGYRRTLALARGDKDLGVYLTGL